MEATILNIDCNSYKAREIQREFQEKYLGFRNVLESRKSKVKSVALVNNHISQI